MPQPNTTPSTRPTRQRSVPRLAVRLTLDTLPARDGQSRYWLSVYNVTRTGQPSTAKTATHHTFGVFTFAEFLAAYALDTDTRVFVSQEASC